MSTQNSPVEIQFRLYPAPGSPDKAEARPSRTGRLPRVTQVMALAIQFQDMIRRGEARDYADLARLGCLTRERISQIMELVWLAPDIQQEILEIPPSGVVRFPVSETAVRRIASPLSWDEQRRAWLTLKRDLHL